MSFGVYDNSSALVKACSTAVVAGVTLVAATGNDSTLMPIFPAALPGVIAVSALDTTNAIANFSNFGFYIDVCSPGVKLYSTLAGTYEWGTWSGTSFAAALVSGTCALAAAVDTSLKALEMQSHIRASACRTLGGMTITPPDPYYGYGCINAADAVWSLASPEVPLRGDVDGSGGIDVSDAVYLCDFIFNSGTTPPLTVADVNCDLTIDISDVVYLIAYIFAGGQPPGCPR
jgi:subtilisin family serine protease